MMTAEEFFSSIKQHQSKELPFVVYRKPGAETPIIGLLQEDDILHQTSAYTETGFVFAPFDDRKESILMPLGNSEKLVLDFFPPLEDAPQNYSPKSSYAKNVSLTEGKLQEREDHIELVQKGVKALKFGGMEKVVLSRKELLELKDSNVIDLFQGLLHNYPTAFVYCWYHPKVGLWLGATPETLVEIDGLNLKTMALAGTQKFNGDLDVEWGEKEKQEQQFVTDSILEALKALEGTEEPRATAPFTSKAGSLLHIRTDISCRLRSTENLRKIIHSLHPTPAVCGLPKEQAKAFILQEEGYDRDFYTGFLGELNLQEKLHRSRSRRNTENLAYGTVRKKTSLFVNLRCMKLQGKEAAIFVGGGITKDSIPADEWQETINKAYTMKRVLEE